MAEMSPGRPFINERAMLEESRKFARNPQIALPKVLDERIGDNARIEKVDGSMTRRFVA